MSAVRRRGDARRAVAPARVALAAGAVPRATYRVQLHSEFRFVDAIALVPYLAALGISHLYCSPYLRARPGSRHGYDIVDHTMLNPEIGTREEFARLVETLRAHGMTHLCDVVPNHMAIFGSDNAWWMDVLENGPASRYARFFDIDWAAQDPFLAGKVLVPVLGEPYGAVLERGELVLAFERDSGTFAIRYFDHRLPLDPRVCVSIVELAAEIAADSLPSSVAAGIADVVSALRGLPDRSDPDPASIARRQADAPAVKARLASLAVMHRPLSTAIDTLVARYNGSPGVKGSFDALNALLEAQAFRLAYWRVASDEINYRRFFDVNDLASLRMEDDVVFDATHGFLLSLLADGHIGGLRIDHPDGLHDPARYFAQLQTRYRELVARRRGVALEDLPGVYVVLEKISASHEHMPARWPVHGDTGYPFANTMTGVLVDPTSRSRMDRAWRAFVGDEARDFDAAARDGKRAIMRGSLAASLNTLASHALRIARADPHTRDFTLSTLRDALAETAAAFPVYRTYVSADGASPQDRRHIDWAVSRARRQSRVADPSVFDFVRSLLLGEADEDVVRSIAVERLAFAMKFQQFTAPVAAKGVEDTAFYTHTRFVALNEVGGEPDVFGLTRRAFHRITSDRASAWPHTLLATSTHDNKRSEDVRARLAVISERPAAWRLLVRRWARLNRSRRTVIEGASAPTRSDEYLLYQTLVGTFPAGGASGDALDGYRERIGNYMIKAAREAKIATSWLRIDADYEQALTAFVNGLLVDRPDNRFLDELRAQAPAFAWFGLLNSLTMTLVKLGAPGVPDFYQGNEMLDLSLVDPDNRRPVDYAARRAALAALPALEHGRAPIASLQPLFEAPHDGRAKLWIVHRMLQHRARARRVYDDGAYLPVTASGGRSRHVLAFARRHEGHGLVIVAGRLFASLGLDVGRLPVGADVWADTTIETRAIAEGTVVTDILTGATFTAGESWPLARLLATFPGAALAW